MTRRFHRAGIPARGQRGFAMIAIISLIVLMSAYLIVNALGRTRAELSNAREQRSMDALRQAKAALIAYAASEQWQLYKGQVTKQPGGLPCPDLDDDGASEGLCSNGLSRVGRLPWTTLGIDDLRDFSGERLWYAVSSNFRRLSGTTIINSDTQGLLTVTGTAPANNVVAIVFAPGQPVGNQNRTTGHNDPASYLEGFTANPTDYTFTTNALPSDTLNDRLIVITQADLMAVVEPVVAARIERDIKPYLDSYRNTWGRYPFAAPFSNPGTSDYKGAAGQQTGFLPLTADPTFVAWQNPLGTVVSGGSITFQDCTASSAALIDCTVTYSGTPTLGFNLAATNAGMALVRSHVVADLTATSGGLPALPTLVSTTNTLLANGTGVVSLSLAMPAAAAPVRIQIPPPPILPAPPITSPSWDNTMMTLATPSSAAGAGWFISNQWYKSAFYAAAPDYLPGGVGSCGATAPCLTVSNLASQNNKAVVILAARSLTGNARPSGVPGDYLEGSNLTAFTTPSYIYEHRAGIAGMSSSTPSVFMNDRVVALP